MNKRTAIIGGGAAGFFTAINLKEMMPEMDVTIFEQSDRVLKKVEISGGGRCNCTNTFAEVSDLSQVYPRGHRLLKRLFKTFNQQSAYDWFERHGVALIVQDDQCVFPQSQDAHTIINMFLNEANRHHIEICKGRRITSLDELRNFDYIVITTGGSPLTNKLQWLEQETVECIPSLYSFNIKDERLQQLMGTIVDEASVFIPATKFRADGTVLITHWGVSGPAVLRLSSYAARHLSEKNYKSPLNINWTGRSEHEVTEELNRLAATCPQKQVKSARPFILSSRLWTYLSEKCLGERSSYKWKDLNRKELNRLVNQLLNDSYEIDSRSVYKDEFVTCGGISLSAVHSNTLESKTIPRLFFAGEVLDIDGVTGGFNFQAAWTTGYTVASAIVNY